MNRKIHRWISLPVAIIMLVVAMTGIALQFEEVERSSKSAPVAPTTSSIPSDNDAAALLSAALAAARRENPSFAGQTVQMSFARGEQKVTISQQPRGGPRIDYDGKSGTAKFVPAPPPSFHGLMVQWHTGRPLGLFGTVLVMITGIALVILSVTGLIVYIDMWKARRRSGRRGLFW